MALRDYAELDEDDFYGQDFERDGVVSLWAGVADPRQSPKGLDVLQDLCGVGFYDLDFQEVIVDEGPAPVAKLLDQLSYKDSFRDAAAKAAVTGGMPEARWLVAQYDFAYDRSRVKRPVAEDPVFLGTFPYRTRAPRRKHG